ncbi:MAG: hypothetical protein JST86_18690 [Bacteroidetes bacterium]|nr:hypothetical protein [Bacteroidota bacterium]
MTIDHSPFTIHHSPFTIDHSQFPIHIMIGVIADDFTGAAELAGISLRYGLKVCVTLNTTVPADFDVVIVCTDSRSMNKAVAVHCTGNAVEAMLQQHPQWIYKKIDSVLRGYVMDEAKVQMELCEKTKAFILPANPSLQRTIEDGEYFINGKKIAETGFAQDPEFPVHSSHINKILNDTAVKVIKLQSILPGAGIVVGEATSTANVEAWARVITNDWVKIGAGDFYAALLHQQFAEKDQGTFELQLPHLYVCGTAFSERKTFIRHIRSNTDFVEYLPEAITEKWITATTEKLSRYKKLILAINETTEDAVVLRQTMAEAAQQLIVRAAIKEIFIEGGSTAAALLQALGIQQLEPVNEWQRGVVRMKAGSLFITVKPGSYALPQLIQQLYKNSSS